MNRIVKIILITAYLAGVTLLLFACSDKLDIQEQYGFTVETMPVPKAIKQRETVEIRCALKEQGTFADNRYTIRYFQFEGKGSLRLGEDGIPFLPNDRYPLNKKEFRLYYTSQSSESQSFTVYFENSFGNKVELEFAFSTVQEKKEEKVQK